MDPLATTLEAPMSDLNALLHSLTTSPSFEATEALYHQLAATPLPLGRSVSLDWFIPDDAEDGMILNVYDSARVLPVAQVVVVQNCLGLFRVEVSEEFIACACQPR